MEIRKYFFLIQKWAWLVAVGALLGISIGYFASVYQTPIYQTSTRVLVRSAATNIGSNPYSFYQDQQLAQNYIEILTTQPILEGTSEKLGYPVYPGQISVAETQQGSSIIRIIVEDSNPQHAADIANQVVQVLIEQNALLQAGQYASSEEVIQVQISQLEDQISKLQNDLDNVSSKSLSEQLKLVTAQMEPLQAEVAEINKEIALLTPPVTQERKVKVAELQARLDQIDPILNLYQQIYTNLVVLGSPSSTVGNDSAVITRMQSTLDLYQKIYLNLITSRESIRLARLQNTPNVVQIEKAIVPTSPIRPRPVMNTLMGGVLGILVAGAIIFLVEFLDDTVKTPEDIESALGLPVIAYVSQMEASTGAEEYLYVARQPRSPISEAFRSLRVNLDFIGVDKPLKTLLVTSAGPGEGKTTISSNLASIIAQAGKTPMLVDADMRRPKVHRVLGISNRAGLSDLFRDGFDKDAVVTHWKANPADEHAIKVVTSGSLPPNPAELLGSERMNHIIQDFEKMADIIIIDSPPTIVADSQVLASRVDGILLVVHPGHTKLKMAIAAYGQFQRAGGHVLGVVFNRIPKEREHYYGGHYYYSSYYSNDPYHTSAPAAADKKGSFSWPFRSSKKNGVMKTRKKGPVAQP